MNERKRRALIVLGMHRSGTSALAGVLGLLGGSLPARLMPASPSNPKGYFEPRQIVAIDDRILAAAGTTWSGWEEIPEAWFLSEPSRVFADELVDAIGEDYAAAPLFVVKDPRMCRLMPLWYRVLDRIDAKPYFVIPLRNPVEIAKSLQNRDGLPLAHGCLLWLRHVLDAERYTRGHPRIFLRYQDLLAAPRSTIDRMQAGLGLAWPRPVESCLREIEAFLDPSLRTQIADEREIDAMGDFSPWLRQAYECHEAFVRSPADRAARRRLDGLQAAFAASDAAFTPLIKHQAEQHATELAALRQTLAARQTEIASFGRALAERENQVIALGNTLLERDTRLAALDQALAERENQVIALGNTLRERDTRLTALDQALAERDRKLGELRDQLADRDANVAALQTTVSALRSSTSWRITGPLRWARRLLGRMGYSAAGYPLVLGWRALRTRSLAPLREWGAVRAVRRSGRFDREWYLKTYPDVAAAGIDPIRHYVAFGAMEGRDPGPSFSARGFLSDNPNVAAAGVNRLLRYLSYLRAAGRAGKTGAYYLLALANIRLLRTLFSSRNVSTALIHIRRGQFRILFARSRQTIMREAAVNSSWIPQMRSSRASTIHALKSDRTLTPVITRRAPHNGHAQLVLLPGYLTVHPDLTADPKPPLTVSVSVVIPTYNGGSEFSWLIKKLKHQKGIGTVEIIIVDSGSRDGTESIANELGCKVFHIPKEEFSHSRSRNIGAEHATGDFLLFMVQDSYPIGDYWLYGLVSCLLHSHDNAQLAALSCAEYSRYDSELLYDALIDTHYKFLGCRNRDRVGSMIGSAHIDLRTQGQISDISCLIRRNIFQQFKFEGRYAEDLSLGIRLIRAGHKVVMVSSIPVIHAHRRPAGYYLRRVFVDVIFLTELFPDFVIPRLTSIRGTLVAAFALREALQKIFFSPQLSSGKALALVINALSDLRLPATIETMTVQGDFGFPPFRSWLDRVEQAAHDLDGAPVEESMVHFKAMYLGRLSELGVFLKTVYPALDEFLALEMNEALEKTLAMTLGAQLAFHYVTAKSGSGMDINSELIIELQNLLVEGI